MVGPRRVGLRSVGARRVGTNISRFFFPSPAPHFRSFSLSLGSSRVHVWVLGLSCETPAAFGAAGVSHDSPITPNKRAHLRVPAFKNTKIQREDPQREREKRAKMEAGEGKKREILGGPVEGGFGGGEGPADFGPSHGGSGAGNEKQKIKKSKHLKKKKTKKKKTEKSPKTKRKTVDHEKKIKYFFKKNKTKTKHAKHEKLKKKRGKT